MPRVHTRGDVHRQPAAELPAERNGHRWRLRSARLCPAGSGGLEPRLLARGEPRGRQQVCACRCSGEDDVVVSGRVAPRRCRPLEQRRPASTIHPTGSKVVHVGVQAVEIAPCKP